MTQRGFTLIEVVAALALTGLAVGGAWRLSSQVGDYGDRVRALSASNSRSANGERLLSSLALGAEVALDPLLQFTGNRKAARFVTWCQVPGAWLQRCVARLSVLAADDSTAVRAELDGFSALNLLRVRGAAVLCYFDSRAGGWVDHWEGIAPPAAIGVAMDDDTLTFVAGAGR